MQSGRKAEDNANLHVGQGEAANAKSRRCFPPGQNEGSILPGAQTGDGRCNASDREPLEEALQRPRPTLEVPRRVATRGQSAAAEQRVAFESKARRHVSQPGDDLKGDAAPCAREVAPTVGAGHNPPAPGPEGEGGKRPDVVVPLGRGVPRDRGNQVAPLLCQESISPDVDEPGSPGAAWRTADAEGFRSRRLARKESEGARAKAVPPS